MTKIAVLDCETGEETVRDMTLQEQADYDTLFSPQEQPTQSE